MESRTPARPIRGLDPLRYHTDDPSSQRASGEMLFIKLRYKDPTGNRSRLMSLAVRDRVTEGLRRGNREEPVQPSSDFTFAASVAAFGMVLRDSEHCGTADLDAVLGWARSDAVLGWARSSVGEDLEGYRGEFVRMVEEARRLADRG